MFQTLTTERPASANITMCVVLLRGSMYTVYEILEKWVYSFTDHKCISCFPALLFKRASSPVTVEAALQPDETSQQSADNEHAFHL